MYTEEKIVKKPRKYYSEDLKFTEWDTVRKELENLEKFEINSKDNLIEFMKMKSEFEAALSEEMAWKYIRMTCNADKPEFSKDFNDFYSKVISPAEAYDFKLKKKFYESPYRKELGSEYDLMNKIISKDIEIFREENIPLKIKEQELSSKYGEIISKLTVEYDGEEKTLSQMGIYQKNPERKIREETWKLVNTRLLEVKDELNDLFDQLKEIRIEIAKNAGFDNYRDYMHYAKGRFDYEPKDVFEFHKSVENVIVPFLKEINKDRKDKLNVENLRPWDLNVDLDGKVLSPFNTEDEFVDKAVEVLHRVKPDFGVKLEKMKNSGFLDLENRKGKAPGGYNYPLHETGGSFIFMNAIGLQGDVRTLLHESGHAMHNFACNHIDLGVYKDYPSELAELASMSMELLTMEHLNVYYSDDADLKKAKLEQLRGTLKVFPWVMTVDAFQQWIYTNPNHTAEEREEFFASLMDRFNTDVEFSGLEAEKAARWLRQLHIFEVPFYYIEYAMSQLGAIAIYKNYKEKGKEAVKMYEEFMSLGYSKSIPELYETAGIKFDFSEEYISDLVEFIKKEIEEVE
ncbi:MAG: M3 family oligoendopeptidase [Thermotogota bacterium]